MPKHTPGPWEAPLWHGTDEHNAQAIAHGLKPVPALTNDGQRFVMAGVGDDTNRVALVDCQTPFKRGKGHQTDCAERDANARLIAAAPELLAALEGMLRAKVSVISDEFRYAEARARAAIASAREEEA